MKLNTYMEKKFCYTDNMEEKYDRVNSPAASYETSYNIQFGSILSKEKMFEANTNTEIDCCLKHFGLENLQDGLYKLKVPYGRVNNQDIKNILETKSKRDLYLMFYQYSVTVSQKFRRLLTRLAVSCNSETTKIKELEKKIKHLEEERDARKVEDRRIVTEKRVKKRLKVARRRLRFIREMQEGPSMDISTIQNQQEEVFI